LYRRIERRNQESGTKTYWDGLTTAQQSVLSQAGWDRGGFNDMGGAPAADALHDPLFYLEALVGGSGLIKAGFGLLASSAAGAEETTSVWQYPSQGPLVSNGITYTKHALQRMMPVGLGGRGIPPSVVQNALSFGQRLPDKDDEAIVHIIDENVTLIVNGVTNTLVTLWKNGH
jgi:hypothetical protein